LFRAEVIANQGQLALDESDFAQAISLSPADGRLYHYRARANQRIMGADQVLADSQRAIDLGWTLASGYDLLGTAYLDLQDYPAADRILTQAVSIAPDYAPAYNNHGVLFDKEGDVDNAIAQYTAAVTHDPLFVLGYNNRGWDLENQGQTDAALADFNTAIGIDSHCSNCWLNHGVFIANYRDDEKSAFQDFSRAIEADPTNALAYANRAISYKALGNPDLEFADLSKAIALEPHSDVANLILGDFYAHQNIFSKAIAAYTIPIENNRGFVAVSSMSRGEVYLAIGRYDEAIADAQVCIASASRRDYIVAARLTSAAAYLYKHDYTSALKDYAAVWSDTTLVPFARYHANDSVTVLTDGALIRILALQLKIALDPGNAALFFQIAPLYMEYGRWQDGVNAYQTYFRLSNQTPPHDLSAILELVVQ